MTKGAVRRPLRVLHCPTTVGGNSTGLVRAERQLGLESVAVAFEQNHFEFATDEVLFSRSDHVLIREMKRWKLFVRALRAFDIVHLNFGRSIMPTGMPSPMARVSDRVGRALASIRLACSRALLMRDLPVLKAAGKGIVVTYQGDDARQADYCISHFKISPAQEVEPGYYTTETDEQKRRAIAYMARYADRIYSVNPDLLHVLPKHAQFMPYASVDMDEWKPGSSSLARSTPVVLHAPSHRGVKGTRHILAAVHRLQSEGVQLEFVLVENMTHAKAKALYEEADLLIDQLLCGWYGGVAVEFMALGKPVVAYIRAEDMEFIPGQMRAELPIINATPSTIYEVMKEWLTGKRHDLVEVGLKSRIFAEKWHNPIEIARCLKVEYETIRPVG